MTNQEISCWECSNCGERIEEQFSECWKCAEQETPDVTKKPKSLFVKIISLIVLIVGGFFIYTGLFSMFLNSNVDAFGLFFEFLGIAVFAFGTVLWGWERKWIVYGTLSIIIGIFVPLIIISTINTMSSLPEMASKVSRISKIYPVILGTILIVFGIAAIIKQKKQDRL